MTNDVEKAEGIDINQITFDSTGAVEGLEEDVLETIAGGLASPEDCPNANC